MDSGELGESLRPFGHSAVMKSAVMKEAAELEQKKAETPTKKQEQFWEIGVDWSNLQTTHSPLDSGKRLGPDMPEGFDWSTPPLKRYSSIGPLAVLKLTLIGNLIGIFH